MIYLVSATPKSEINKIIYKRGLNKYFKKIYGAPIIKHEVLNKIMINEKATASEIVFIGDTIEDQKAAKKLGICFVGRQSDRPLDKLDNNIFNDFFKIKDYLDKLFVF